LRSFAAPASSISSRLRAFLGLAGGFMLVSRQTIVCRRGRPTPLRAPSPRNWLSRLPWQMRFRRSHLHISVIPLVALGLGIGFLAALLGVGGGFLVVPALIYLFRVPTGIVIGTSLVQIVGTMAVATALHAVTNQSVDAVLALILMIGSVIGAQFSARSARSLI
jgi:uncharacterized membrane protein YfcA